MDLRALLTNLQSTLETLTAAVVQVSRVAAEARRGGVHAERAAMGAHAFYTLPQAVRLIPMPAKDAHAFLLAHGLIRRVEGADLVHWGSVEAALNGCDPESVPLPAPLQSSVRAARLPERVRLR